MRPVHFVLFSSVSFESVRKHQRQRTFNAPNTSALVKLQRVLAKVLNFKMSTTFNAMGLFYNDLLSQLNKISLDQEKLYSCVEDIEVIPAYNFFGEIKLKFNQVKTNPSSDLNDHDLMKLPNIEIPKFDGDFKKWPTIKNLFEEMVHHREISDIRKMIYLQQVL